MAVTLKEVAKLANVSRATVDKVIHRRPGVKKETQERVQAILKELNYQPNLIGKALVNSKKNTKLGVILTPDYNTYIQDTLKGIRKAEREYSRYGFEVVVKMLTSLEPAEAIGILNEFHEMKIPGLAVLPIDDPQIKSKLNQMAQSGIAIVPFNSQLEGIQQLCFIGQDHYRGGKVAAGLMEKLLPDGGQVGIIISSKRLSCHQQRLAGFVDRLNSSKAPFEVVGIRESQDRKEEVFRYALDYCNKFPDLKGIYLASNGLLGINSALAIANRKYKVKVICHDLLPETSELLKDGMVDFILGQNAAQQGYQAVKVLAEYLITEQPPSKKVVEIPVEIFTSDLL